MPSLMVRLSERRVRAGKSKAQLAALFGVSRQTVHAWESGTIPQMKHTAKLAKFLGEDATQLRRELYGVADG